MDIFAPNGFDIKNGVIWFVPFKDRAFCGYSIEKKKIVFIKTIPDIDNKPGMFRNVMVSNNKAYLIPSKYNRLVVYDFNSDSFEDVIIENCAVDDNFYSAYIASGYLFIFPGKNKKIIRISLSDYSMSKFPLPDFYTQNENVNSYLQFSSCQIGDFVALLPLNTKALYLFKLNDGTWKNYSYKKEGYFCSVSKINDKTLLLTDERGDLIYYDIEYGTWKNVANQSIGFKSDRYSLQIPCFTDSFIWEETFYAFPGLANMIIESKLYSNEVVGKQWSYDFEIESRTQLFSKIILVNDKAYGFCVSKKELIEIDLINHSIHKLPYVFSDECKDDLLRYVNNIYNSEITHEGENISGNIKLFIDSIFYEGE